MERSRIVATGAGKQRIFLFIGLATFSLLGLIGILNHSLWRDEANPWLIGRDSHGLVDLFNNLKYEGHPILWYLILYGLNQFSANPVLMQISHWLLGTAAAYLFLRFSPFSRLQKVLFIFGFFPFYEYFMISRNYAIGLLMAFSICTVFPTRKKTYLLLALLLFLLANCNAFGLLITIGLTATLVLEALIEKRSTQEALANDRVFLPEVPVWDKTLSLSIVGLGMVLALSLLIQPADSTAGGGQSEWFLQFDWQRLGAAITRIGSGYIAVYSPTVNQAIELIIGCLATLALVTLITLSLIKKPLVLCFYWVTTCLILTFNYTKFIGFPRHYGHYYLVLIMALWLSSYYPQSLSFAPANLSGINNTGFSLLRTKIFASLSQWMTFAQQQQRTLITLILVLHFVAGIVAFSRNLFIPFSASRQTTEFIANHQLNRWFIVGSRDVNMTPISAYLQQKIYYPETRRVGSFTVFSQKRQDVGEEEVLMQLQQLNQVYNPLILILNYELVVNAPVLKISKLAHFKHSFLTDERYQVYCVTSANHPLACDSGSLP